MKFFLSVLGAVAIHTCADLYASTMFPKVIYGTDNRHDVFDYHDWKIAELAKSTVALIQSSSLEVVDQELSISALLSVSFRDHAFLCSSERFKDQPVGAFCSGFLVSPNKIATAGHCIDSIENCRNTKFVFDYAMKDEIYAQTTFLPSQVYNCKKIIKTKNENNGSDFALIELDRNVEDRTPLKLSKKNLTKVGSQVFTIGYPSGLPVKITDDAQVRSVNTSKGYFVTNLDTYHGNSGSPVFNSETLEVEGILVRGLDDFVVSRDGCNKSSQVFDEGGKGEDVTFISQLMASSWSESHVLTPVLSRVSSFPYGDFQVRANKSICLVHCENSIDYTAVTRMIWNDPLTLITSQEQCQKKAELTCRKE